MSQDALIYNQLIAERGDIPAQVRREAEQTLRELDQVMRRPGLSAPGFFEPARPASQSPLSRPALGPGQPPRYP
ncbi:hypothetical protein [Streptomyces cavernae]|uniref:hypothetical protein n=1 Tax=Streptomyces cavernae TaxID=2259034 RepID=UPI000FEBC2F1|nr:hypothetical protein [Streptomyces cavernae]